MDSRIQYEVCPACGFNNAQRKRACPACDNRLFSDGEEEHRRYVALIVSEHRKHTLLLLVGWAFVAFVFVVPFLLLAAGRFSYAPSAGALIAGMLTGWRLIDIKKKRDGSARFLTKHNNA